MARAQWQAVADQLRGKFSNLEALMDEAENDVLAFGALRELATSHSELAKWLDELKQKTEALATNHDTSAATRIVS